MPPPADDVVAGRWVPLDVFGYCRAKLDLSACEVVCWPSVFGPGIVSMPSIPLVKSTDVMPSGTDGEGLPWIARMGVRRMGVLVADIA